MEKLNGKHFLCSECFILKIFTLLRLSRLLKFRLLTRISVASKVFGLQRRFSYILIKKVIATANTISHVLEITRDANQNLKMRKSEIGASTAPSTI